MTIDQKDIIDEIDKLHAEATPGPWSVYGVVCHIEVVCGWPNGDVVPVLRMHKEGDWPSNGAPPYHIAVANAEFVAKLRNNWPALRDRLREAERKAKAFDAIASGDVELYEIHRPAYWTVETTSDPLRAVSDPDLLTAIEAATREAKP